MTRFHDCKRSGCETDPYGVPWAVDARGNRVYGTATTLDNNTGVMITPAAARTRTPKEE